LTAIVTSLFAVAPAACEQHVSWRMQPGSISIHPIEVFYYRSRLGEVAQAIRTFAAKADPDKFAIIRSLYTKAPIAAHLPAQLMQKHANEFVGYIGLSTSGSGP